MKNLNLEGIENYEYVAVRALSEDEDYNVGDTCRNSFDHDYENDVTTYGTDEEIELNGTCGVDTTIDTFYDEEATMIEKIENAMNHSIHYIGKKVLIVGNTAECGNDDMELIIEDAIVFAEL